MSELEALKEAMHYIAHCLDEGRAYQVTDDIYVTDTAMHKLLAEFALKRADGDNVSWVKWCNLRANANLTG